MKTVEDLNVRGFCAQDTVGVGALIRMSIVSCQPVAFRQITLAGFAPETTTFFPRKCCRKFFAASSSTLSSGLFRMASSASMET